MRKILPKVDPRDPTVRSDGRCSECKRERPPLAVKHRDPFCSSACCQAFYRRLKAKEAHNEGG